MDNIQECQAQHDAGQANQAYRSVTIGSRHFYPASPTLWNQERRQAFQDQYQTKGDQEFLPERHILIFFTHQRFSHESVRLTTDRLMLWLCHKKTGPVPGFGDFSKAAR
jgi:hypothetical protein